MIDTSGFYKIDPASGELLHGPNFVHGPGFLLERDGDRTPTDGWHWFNSEDEARAELVAG